MGKKGFFRQWFDSLSEEEKTAYYVDQQDVNPSIILAKIHKYPRSGKLFRMACSSGELL